jgi:AraC-like DNA-binding protein
MTKLFFKNMVSDRCKVLVKSELEKHGLHCLTLELGVAEIQENISIEMKEQLTVRMKKLGFSLIEDKKSILVEKVKSIIIELVHFSDHQIKTNLSVYLSEKLEYDYTYLANIFSEIHGNTIERYFLSHRIERAKELLAYNEMNINEIAIKLHFSSAAHLSSQFKEFTGLTPSEYKHNKFRKRQPLEKL